MIFDNCVVVTMDPRRRILRDGAIAVVGSSIVAVGDRVTVRAQYPDEPVKDLRGWLVMPGLVDGHVHLPQALLRGSADELPLHQWMASRIFVLEGNFTPADAKVSARLAIVEMLKAGTTTFLETLVLGRHALGELADVVAETGMRAVLPRAVGDGGGYLDEAPLHEGLREPPDIAMEEAVAVADQWKDSEQIKIWLGPRSTGGCPEPLLREVVETARSRGMGICQHYAMTDRELAYLRNNFDATPGEYLHRVGLVGADVVLAHCSGLPPEEIPALVGTGTSVVHCPTGPAKMGSGITPVRELVDAGVNVALGTDANAANNGADLIRDFKWVSYLQKLRHHDPTVVPGEAVLEMATLGGARALSMGHLIGSIEVGKRADFIVLRTDAPHWTPADYPVSNLVYSATGADVDTVVINGDIVMEGRHLLHIDEEEVLRDAAEHSRNLYERTGLEVRTLWPME
ncbi:amidohydrolase [Actinopolymorpha sp. B11F2]|uniref:amidohydrolase family protein n=1 Tax=Actinopolymorpha sp. B11F2 TaxID=3160862 RepID=UPI0032E52907